MLSNCASRLLPSVSFFFSSRRRHTRFSRHWSSDVCSSDLWDYFSSEIMCEQERQQIMPELIRYLDKLYEMVDVNAKNWKRGFDKFKFSNIENSLEFNMNFYVEMLYAGMGNNPTIFPENLCGNWTRSEEHTSELQSRENLV